MAHVLCTGADAALMKTRQLLLERAGHSVVLAMGERELATACQNNQFDVAIIGQSLSSRVKIRVAELVRTHCPSVKLLELYPANSERAILDADSWLRVPSDRPDELPQIVNELVSPR